MFYIIDNLTNKTFEVYDLKYTGRNISIIRYITDSTNGVIDLETIYYMQFVKCLRGTNKKRYNIIIQ